MLSAKAYTGFVCVIVGAALLGGCATDPFFVSETKHYRRAKPATNVAARKPKTAVAARQVKAPVEAAKVETQPDAVPLLAPIETGTLQTRGPQGAVKAKDDPRWKWCEQRHLDHKAGRAPGGAVDLAEKLEGDRICASIYDREG